MSCDWNCVSVQRDPTPSGKFRSRCDYGSKLKLSFTIKVSAQLSSLSC